MASLLPQDDRPVEPAQPDRVTSGRPSRFAGRAIVWARWPVVVAWLVACAAVYYGAPTLSQLPSAGLTALIPTNTSAFHVEHHANRLFGMDLLPRLAVVQRDPHGLSLAKQRRIVRLAVHLDEGKVHALPKGTLAFPLVNTLKIVPAARERSTTAITYLGFPSRISPTKQRDYALQYARAASEPGARGETTGFITGVLDESIAIEQSLHWVEIASLALIAVIIGVYLRSLLAPIVTLVSAGIAYILSTRSVALLGLKTGIRLNKEVEPVVVVLLLGVVTDYSVFFLSGMRTRMRGGDARLGAARRTTQLFLPIVFTAGFLVAAGLSTLQVGSLGFIRALGPAMAIVVIVSLFVAITLVPAAMAIFGRFLFWPGIRGDPEAGGGRATRGRRLRVWLARLARFRSVSALAVVICAVALMAAGSGLFHTRLSLTPISGLTSAASAERGATEAGKGFAAGVVSPTELVLERRGIAKRPVQLAAFTVLLAREPEVSAVVGAGEVPVKAPWNVFRTKSGNAVRFLVVFPHEPFGAAAISDLSRLQHQVPGLLARVHLGGTSDSYAGDTAISKDSNLIIYHDLKLVALTVFLVNLVLLCVFLRSLVAPLLLVAASALALAAAFGLTTYFFQDLLGYGQLTYYVPLAVGVLLASFGSDYNLFIVGRIWQESEEQTVAEAIADVAPKASRAISVAALALALSFATLAIVPLASFREFAFSMAVGVLVDSFIVRSFLIPALLAVLGRASWWPGARSRAAAGVGSA